MNITGWDCNMHSVATVLFVVVNPNAQRDHLLCSPCAFRKGNYWLRGCRLHVRKHEKYQICCYSPHPNLHDLSERLGGFRINRAVQRSWQTFDVRWRRGAPWCIEYPRGARRLGRTPEGEVTVGLVTRVSVEVERVVVRARVDLGQRGRAQVH